MASGSTEQKPWELNWEILQRGIGGGGQGTTHLVKSRRDGTKAVLKELIDTHQLQARRRMRLEVVALETLAEFGAKVPVPIDNNSEDVDELDVPLFFTMEFIEGTTLDKYIKERGPLDLANAIDIVEQVAGTIGIGHREKLIHRDIKPKNIMLSDVNGRVEAIVLDYGISFNDQHDEGLTTTNENFWNEFLTLPETNVHGEDRRDFRTDVTALCGILFFCVSGKYPQWLLDSDARSPHRRPGAQFHGVADTSDEFVLLNSLFTRGFQPRADHRFQSVEEFLKNIDSIKSCFGGENQSISVVAQRESELLRLHDRATQLTLITPKIPKLHEQLLSEIGASWKKQNLDLFKINAREVRFSTSEIKDATLRPEWLYTISRAWVLTIPHHNRLKEIAYALGVSGDELHVLRYVRNANPGKFEQPELLTVSPINEHQELDVVVADFGRWLQASMKALRSEILADSSRVPA